SLRGARLHAGGRHVLSRPSRPGAPLRGALRCEGGAAEGDPDRVGRGRHVAGGRGGAGCFGRAPSGASRRRGAALPPAWGRVRSVRGDPLRALRGRGGGPGKIAAYSKMSSAGGRAPFSAWSRERRLSANACRANSTGGWTGSGTAETGGGTAASTDSAVGG